MFGWYNFQQKIFREREKEFGKTTEDFRILRRKSKVQNRRKKKINYSEKKKKFPVRFLDPEEEEDDEMKNFESEEIVKKRFEDFVKLKRLEKKENEEQRIHEEKEKKLMRERLKKENCMNKSNFTNQMLTELMDNVRSEIVKDIISPKSMKNEIFSVEKEMSNSHILKETNFSDLSIEDIKKEHSIKRVGVLEDIESFKEMKEFE